MPFSTYTADVHKTTGRTTNEDFFSYDNRLTGFSSDVCVFADDIKMGTFNTEEGTSSLLINSNTNEVIYSQNAFNKVYPASITKLMTAYVALKYLSPDSVITCTEDVENITVPGAVLLGLKKGDSFTLDQALHLALLSSFNDVAVAIACGVSGNVDDFAALMTEEAKKLGCTQTNFVNPSGLPDDYHYTSAYDLYLIFNEVIKTPFIVEVMQCKDYTTMIRSASGNEKEVSSYSTNRYFWNEYQAPTNITVVGGKTGTTDEAGHCLMLLVRDRTSTPYIALILGEDTTDGLYNEMTEMLNLCEKSSNQP